MTQVGGNLTRESLCVMNADYLAKTHTAGSTRGLCCFSSRWNHSAVCQAWQQSFNAKVCMWVTGKTKKRMTHSHRVQSRTGQNLLCQPWSGPSKWLAVNWKRDCASLKNVRAPADELESGVNVITDPLTHSHGHHCCPQWERSLLVEIQAEGWDLKRDWTHADGRHARAEKPFRLSQGKISPDAKEQNDLCHCLLAIIKQTHFCFIQEVGEYNWINMNCLKCCFLGLSYMTFTLLQMQCFFKPSKKFLKPQFDQHE